MSVHVIKATAAPTSAPTRSGVHHIDTISKKNYFSVGTSTVADWVEIGTGSGTGTSSGDSGINYILRGTADTGIDGWNIYKDAAAALPVDAAQGGNLASITFTQNTTSPLRGTADFRLTKPASNAQGEGVSYDFTIARADLGKTLGVYFDYEVVSGTFATNDLTVYIVQDPTGTPTVIQPSVFRIDALSGTTKGRFIAAFQAHASALNHRLAFHVASSSAVSFALGIDRISVGPQTTASSEPVVSIYKTAAGQSIPSGAFTVVNYATKEIDTHNAVTVGAAWKFTAPFSDTYSVSAHVLFNSGASATTSSYLISLYKAGTLIAEFGRVNGTGGVNFFGPTGSRDIYLSAGETIDARTLQDSGGARTLYPFSEYNFISIHRTGT